MKSGSRQDSFEAEASQNGGTMHGSQNGGPNTPPMMVNQTMPIMPVAAAGAPGVPGPTTNLNIGMDYWGAATSSTLPALRGKAPPTPVAGGMVTAGSRDSVQSQLWLQMDELVHKAELYMTNWHFLDFWKDYIFLYRCI
ncbi:unnamed protein product [Camellia sinensis]